MDRSLSAVCSAASNRQDHSIFADNAGQESDRQKLLLGSPASSQTRLAVRAARRAQLHTSSFSKHASLSGDPSQIAEADLQHQPGPSTLCPAPPDPSVPLLESSEGEPEGQLCHLLHAATTAETREPSTGSSTIHTCQPCQP